MKTKRQSVTIREHKISQKTYPNTSKTLSKLALFILLTTLTQADETPRLFIDRVHFKDNGHKNHPPEGSHPQNHPEPSHHPGAPPPDGGPPPDPPAKSPGNRGGRGVRKHNPSSSEDEMKCMIDNCKDCDFENVYTCNQCKAGYYITSFYGQSKRRDYQHCWKRSTYWMSIFAVLLFIGCYLPCLCYLAFHYGLMNSKKQRIVYHDESSEEIEEYDEYGRKIKKEGQGSGKKYKEDSEEKGVGEDAGAPPPPSSERGLPASVTVRSTFQLPTQNQPQPPSAVIPSFRPAPGRVVRMAMPLRRVVQGRYPQTVGSHPGSMMKPSSGERENGASFYNSRPANSLPMTPSRRSAVSVYGPAGGGDDGFKRGAMRVF